MKRSAHLRRGIYLLPTLFTVGNLFCGFCAIMLAVRGEFATGAVLIIVAGVLDGLDGRIARLTGTTSDFGVQFDSLADIVSFGIAPALLAYQWALVPIDRIGWLVAFIYLVCAAMRLARFNIQIGRGDKRWFAGLPSPAAAGAVASVVFAFPDLGQTTTATRIALVSILVAGVGLLMISRLRYWSFKDIGLRHPRSYTYVLPLAFVIVAIAVNPQTSLLLFAALYVASAPLLYLYGVVRRLDDGDLVPVSPDAEIADKRAAR
jgi:CDP-diacylglycerol--serine O-phosphatidyltransferase